MNETKTTDPRAAEPKTTNVKLPLALLRQTIELLGYIDISHYDDAIKHEYDNVLVSLNHKLQKVDLRKAYSEIVFAKDEDSRHAARMRYLQQKRDIYFEWPFWTPSSRPRAGRLRPVKADVCMRLLLSVIPRAHY